MDNVSKELQPKSFNWESQNATPKTVVSVGVLWEICCFSPGTRRCDTTGHSLALQEKVKAIRGLGYTFLTSSSILKIFFNLVFRNHFMLTKKATRIVPITP